ncbi:TetR family transcriptional regulator [Mycobacterium bohemicum]|uniref:TetR family transcriptional regulator n=1 Tax=Mycobacterium bohemicum TaxID=56425 RepID=A0A1X1RB69_MYCBE|nr:TetR family transcriptional regulator [Mycobacterium bohemicum]
MFSERGYDGATFQAIAVGADLTRPAINHYFSSKKALYREVLEQTNDVVINAGIRQAAHETTLVGRLTAFISVAVRANADNPAVSAFLVTAVLESQRHPELSLTENDSVSMARGFLTSVVNDAIEHGEVASDVEPAILVETLLVVLSGVGFYAGYLRSSEAMLGVSDMLRRLLEGALWRPEG